MSKCSFPTVAFGQLKTLIDTSATTDEIKTLLVKYGQTPEQWTDIYNDLANEALMDISFSEKFNDRKNELKNLMLSSSSEVDNIQDKIVTEDINESISSRIGSTYFYGKSIAFNEMVTSLQDSMMKYSYIDFSKGKINLLSNQVSDGVLAYREFLRSELGRELGLPDGAIENIIQQAEARKETLSAQSYNSYVILKEFDALISAFTPYIHKVGDNKYKLASDVEMRDSWTTEDYKDANLELSELTKAIIRSIPVERGTLTINQFHTLSNKLLDYLNSKQIKFELNPKSIYDNITLYLTDSNLTNKAYLTPEEKKNLRSIQEAIFGYGSVETGSSITSLRNMMIKFQLTNNSNGVDPLANIMSMMSKIKKLSFRAYKNSDTGQGGIEGTEIRTTAVVRTVNSVLDNINANVKAVRESRRLEHIELIDVQEGEEGRTRTSERVIKIKNEDNLIKYTIRPNEVVKQISLGDEIYTEEVSLTKGDAFFASTLDDNDIRFLKSNLYIDLEAASLTEDAEIVALFNIAYKSIQSVQNDNAKSLTYSNVGGTTMKFLGNVMTTQYGGNYLSTALNRSGNPVPVYQLNTLGTNASAILQYIRQHTDTSYSALKDNFFVVNPEFATTPQIRLQADISRNVTETKDLNENDAVFVDAIFDFMKPIVDYIRNDTASDVNVFIQPTTYADKGKHYVNEFNLTRIADALKMPSEDVLNSNKWQSKFYDLYSKRYLQIEQNIINDFNTVFGSEYTSMNEIADVLQGVSLKSLEAAFRRKGVDLVPNYHYSGTKDGLMVNQMLLESLERAKDKKIFDAYMDSLFDEYSTSLETALENLNISSVRKKRYPWLLSTEKDIKDHPILERMLLNKGDGKYEINTKHPILRLKLVFDAFMSDQYTSALTGETFMHGGKDSGARTTARYKREMQFGSNIHPFAQNVLEGLPSVIKQATIRDPQAILSSITGETDMIDAKDGSGLASPITSRLENYSLGDAAAGSDKKTIMLGDQKMVKWKVDEISNAAMRQSRGAKQDLLTLFKKMHDEVWTEDINIAVNFRNYSINFRGMYFSRYNYDTRVEENYAIRDVISHGNNYYTFRYALANDKGGPIRDANGGIVFIEEQKTITSLYDLYQALGGLEAKTVNKKGELSYSEFIFDKMTEVVNTVGSFAESTEEEYRTQENTYQPLKSKMISYAIYQSAYKQGARNLNDTSVLDRGNLDPLWTHTMPTAFSGVIMDAEHDIDASLATEPTQMMSSLAQMGINQDAAQEVYNALATLADEIINEYEAAINGKSPQEIQDYVRNLILKSFNQDDDFSLAGSLLKLENVPFSDPSLFGLSTSKLIADVSKRVIKRKWSGSGQVLKASYDTHVHYHMPIVVNDGFDVAGNPVSHVEYVNTGAKGLRELALQLGFLGNKDNNILPEDALINVTYQAVTSNFGLFSDMLQTGALEPMSYGSTNEPLRPGDTVWVVHDGNAEEVVVKSLSDLFLVNDAMKSTEPNVRVYRLNFRPVNLRPGYNVLVAADGSKYIDLELPIVRELHNAKLAKKDKAEIKRLTQILQDDLSKLSDGTFQFPSNHPLSQGYTVETHYAQASMGQLYASRLLLEKEDSLSQIKRNPEEFYSKRVAARLRTVAPINLPYDIVLKKMNGRHTYVIVGSSMDQNEILSKLETRTTEVPITTINGVQYRANENGDPMYPIQGMYHFEVKIDNEWQSVVRMTPEVFENQDVMDSFVTDEYVAMSYNSAFTESGIPEKSNVDNAVKKLVTNNKSSWLAPWRKQLSENKEGLIGTWLSISFDEVNSEYEQNLTQQLSDAFRESVYFMATRIPTQSFQSFMGMEIAFFADTDTNGVYVPAFQTWIQGSDYDVDKLYMIGYSIDKNGRFDNWSDVWHNFLHSEAKSLSLPNGKMMTMTREGDEMHEYATDLSGSLAYLSGIDLMLYLSSTPTNIFTYVPPQSNDGREANSIETIEYYLNLANKHNATRLGSKQKGVQNFILQKLLKIVAEPKTQVMLQTPISMERSRGAASSIATKQIDNLNPADRFQVQSAAMVGKEVVGIQASAIKGYLALLQNFNQSVKKYLSISKYPEIRFNSELGKEILDDILFVTRVNGKLRFSIANGNIKDIKEDIRSWLLEKESVNWAKRSEEEQAQLAEALNEEFEIAYQESLNNEDASEVLGDLLNSATDNAKEMNLAKINATKQLAPLYNALLISGYSFEFATDILLKNLGGENDVVKDFAMQSVPSLLDTNKGTFKKVLALYNKKHDSLKGAADAHEIMMVSILAEIQGIAETLRNYVGALGINQGMKTKISDFLSYMQRLGATTAQEYSSLVNSEPKREASLGISSGSRDALHLPHYRAMMKAPALVNKILSAISYSYRGLVDSSVLFGSRNERATRYVSEGGNEVLMAETLMNIKGLKFIIPAGADFFNTDRKITKTEEDLLVEISSISDLNSFAKVMTEHIIPALQEQYPTNGFLSELIRATQVDNVTQVEKNYYKPFLNMRTIESTHQKLVYKNMVEGFTVIAGKQLQKGDGKIMTIGDAFFLYNLLLHKGKYGTDKLTRIFSDMLLVSGNVFNTQNENTPLISRYYNMYGKLDVSKESVITVDKNGIPTEVPTLLRSVSAVWEKLNGGNYVKLKDGKVFSIDVYQENEQVEAVDIIQEVKEDTIESTCKK